jgi:hypothetical protein
MGYQFVEATLPDDRTKRGVAYNGELLLFEEEPRYLLRTEYKTLFRTAKSAVGEIKSLRFDPRPRPTTLRSASAAKAAPAKDAPQEKTKAGEVFKRFSAYENDNRVRDDRSLRDGTYATTQEDAKNVDDRKGCGGALRSAESAARVVPVHNQAGEGYCNSEGDRRAGLRPARRRRGGNLHQRDNGKYSDVAARQDPGRVRQ